MYLIYVLQGGAAKSRNFNPKIIACEHEKIEPHNGAHKISRRDFPNFTSTFNYIWNTKIKPIIWWLQPYK